jgi:hypothetical protein
MVRVASDGERELSLMRWGFPPPPNLGRVPVTNVRNMASPYWRGWLKAQWRCLVPATSFCEWTASRPKVTNWFALDESRPLFAFAGSPALPVFAFVPFVEKFIGHPFSSWPSSHRNPREALHRIKQRASR